MSALTASPNDLMRRAVVAMDEAFVLEVVDSLNLVGVKLPAVVAVPLKSLQKKHDLESFAAGAPIGAVAGLLELLGADAFERVVTLLGDHAEDPTYPQLKAAIEALRAEGGSRNHVIAVLAYAAGQEFPAGPSCRQILSEEADLALPALTITVGTASLLNPKSQDAAVLEQRRQRREEEKARKKAQAAKTATKAKPEKKTKSVTPPTLTAPVTSSPAPTASLPITRRDTLLTPAEAANYAVVHPLVGWVVATEVPFDDVDPSLPDQSAKHRPALVVAASETGMLVRGIYSQSGPTRVLFGPWRRVGLDHASYLDATRMPIGPDVPCEKLLKLTDEEWSGLL